MNMDWKKYEKEIFYLFTNDFPEAEITYDVISKKMGSALDIRYFEYNGKA